MADRALPDLVGRSRLDNRLLKRDVAEAKGEITGIGKSAQGAGNIIEGAFGKASSALTGKLGPAGGIAQKALDGIGASAIKSGNLIQTAIVGGAAAAAVGIAALAIKGVSEFQNLAQKVRDFDRVAGAGAETSSRFVSVLDDMGIEADAGAKAISKFSRELDSGKLEDFGISIERTRDGTVDLIGTLENVSDAYRQTEDPAKRAEIRFAAFGRQGDNLIPILEKGRTAIREMFAEVPKGELLSQEDLDNAEQFRLAMDRLGDAVANVERNLGRRIVPLLSTAADVVSTIVEKFDEGFDVTLGGGASKISETIARVREEHDKAKEAASDHQQSEDDLKRSMADAATQADAEADALNRLFLAQIQSVDSALGLTSAQLSYRDAIDNARQKQDDLNKAIAEHGPKSAEATQAARDLERAQLDAEQSALRQASAVVELNKKTHEAAGETYTAEQQMNDFRNALQNAAAQADGPIKTALIDLAEKYLPPVEGTHNIAVELTGAERVKAQLREIGQLLNIQAKQLGLPGVPLPPGRMAGGPVIAGHPYVVGEKHAELFVPNVSGRILPSVPRGWDGAAASPVATAGGTYVITVPLEIDGREVARGTVRFTAQELERYRVNRS